MLILSWNIQKINLDKAAQFAPVLGKVVSEVSAGRPFVLVVYENRAKPEDVLAAIGTGIDASEIVTKHVSTQGANNLRENILLIAGNGAKFDEPTAFTAWMAPFEAHCQRLHQAEISTATSHTQRLGALRSTRASTSSAREDRLAAVQEGTFRNASDFRCPISVVVRSQGTVIKMLALHAPGPDQGSEHEDPYAAIYTEAVLSKAAGHDLVVGDFNIRTNSVRSGGFVDRGVRLGATTKGKEHGRHTYSRLDRAYSRPGLTISTQLVSDSVERDLTDHHCLAVTVERRAQRKMTDYFPHKPSPRRQQEIRFMSRQLALGSRAVSKESKLNEERAKRRAEYEQGIHDRRAEAYAAGRKKAAAKKTVPDGS